MEKARHGSCHGASTEHGTGQLYRDAHYAGTSTVNTAVRRATAATQDKREVARGGFPFRGTKVLRRLRFPGNISLEIQRWDVGGGWGDTVRDGRCQLTIGPTEFPQGRASWPPNTRVLTTSRGEAIWSDGFPPQREVPVPAWGLPACRTAGTSPPGPGHRHGGSTSSPGHPIAEKAARLRPVDGQRPERGCPLAPATPLSGFLTVERLSLGF